MSIRNVAAAIFFFFLMYCSAAVAVEFSCTVLNQSGSCAPPVSDPWYCAGNSVNEGSSPECGTTSGTGHCTDHDEVRAVLTEKEAEYNHACSLSSELVPPYFAQQYYLGILDNLAIGISMDGYRPVSGDPCNHFTVGGTAHCSRFIHCPPGYQDETNVGTQVCFRPSAQGLPFDPDKNKGMCPASTGGAANTSHPINIGTGNKFLAETDVPRLSGGLEFRRFYNSTNTDSTTPLGKGWQHNYNLRLDVDENTGVQYDSVAVAIRSDGRVLRFLKLSSGSAGRRIPMSRTS